MGKEAENHALILATGDIIIDEPDPYSFFEPSREFLAKGDFVIGQIEVPHTDRGEANSTDIPAPPAPPENLNPLKDCGSNRNRTQHKRGENTCYRVEERDPGRTHRIQRGGTEGGMGNFS